MASQETAAPELRDSTGRIREFAFDDGDFESIRALVKASTGINLTVQKRELVYGRLAVRLRALGLRTRSAADAAPPGQDGPGETGRADARNDVARERTT